MFAASNEMTRVELTLYTDALITRGSVRSRQRRVTDVLNLSTESFLVLEDATVEEIGIRAQPIRAGFVQVNLDAVLFAVANEPVRDAPELRTPKSQQQAILSVPPFKVVGTIHLLPTSQDLREALVELRDRFIPVTNATFWSEAAGESRQDALLVAVNHRRTQIMAQYEAPDPWAGIRR